MNIYIYNMNIHLVDLDKWINTNNYRYYTSLIGTIGVVVDILGAPSTMGILWNMQYMYPIMSP